MLKLLATAGLAALLAACAVPAPSGPDPMHEARGSTPAGASKAAGLGFHGPETRSPATIDGPN